MNKNSKNILLVWEEDGVRFYVLPYDKTTAQQRHYLKQAHGYFANTEEGADNEGLDFLVNALSAKPEFCDPKSDPEIRCIWHPYLIDAEKPIQAEIAVVYHSGFAL